MASGLLSWVAAAQVTDAMRALCACMNPAPLMAVDPQFSPVPLRHMSGDGQASAAGTT